MRSPRHAHTTAIKITFAVLLTAALAACSSDSDLPPPASATPPPSAETPSLNLTPAEQQAVEEAQALFDDFMTAYVEVSTADLPTAQTAEDIFYEVDQHAAGLLSQELRTEIVGRWSQSQVGLGEMVWSLHAVDGVELDYEINGDSYPTVHLVYCIDGTNFAIIDAESRESVDGASGQALWRYTLQWSEDWFGQGIVGWRVTERFEQGVEC